MAGTFLQVATCALVAPILQRIRRLSLSPHVMAGKGRYDEGRTHDNCVESAATAPLNPLSSWAGYRDGNTLANKEFEKGSRRRVVPTSAPIDSRPDECQFCSLAGALRHNRLSHHNLCWASVENSSQQT